MPGSPVVPTMKRIRVDQAMLRLNRLGGDRPSILVESAGGDYLAHRADLTVAGEVVASVVQHARGSVVIEVPDAVEVRIGFRDGAGWKMLETGERAVLPRGRR